MFIKVIRNKPDNTKRNRVARIASSLTAEMNRSITVSCILRFIQHKLYNQFLYNVCVNVRLFACL